MNSEWENLESEDYCSWRHINGYNQRCHGRDWTWRDVQYPYNQFGVGPFLFWKNFVPDYIEDYGVLYCPLDDLYTPRAALSWNNSLDGNSRSTTNMWWFAETDKDGEFVSRLLEPNCPVLWDWAAYSPTFDEADLRHPIHPSGESQNQALSDGHVETGVPENSVDLEEV